MRKLALLFALFGAVSAAHAADSDNLPALKGGDRAPNGMAFGCGLPGGVRDTPGVPLVCSADGKWVAMYTKTAVERIALYRDAFGCVIVGPDNRKLNSTSMSDIPTFFPKGTRFTPACQSPN